MDVRYVPEADMRSGQVLALTPLARRESVYRL